jgi:hypothetical protein
LRGQFEDMLLRWAGVETTAEGSRGQFVDAIHLAFVEKFFWTNYKEVYIDNTLTTSPSTELFGAPLHVMPFRLRDASPMSLW